MKIEIQSIPLEQKIILRNLMQLYQYDFSELSGEDINEYARFEYNYLDYYWTEEKRFPYLIRVEDKIAGFVLVNDHLLSNHNGEARSLAEFFILRKFRRRGIGSQVAKKIFSSHSGPWEVTTLEYNKAAISFWTKTISDYTNGKFEEIVRNGDDWDGRIYKFG